jgi:hypothetical protein
MFRKFVLLCLIVFTPALAGCGRWSDNIEAMGENMTGGECSWSRYVDGKDFCRHDKAEIVPHEPLYCYKSVGSVECFREPQAGRRLNSMGSQPIAQTETKKTAPTSSE